MESNATGMVYNPEDPEAAKKKKGSLIGGLMATPETGGTPGFPPVDTAGDSGQGTGVIPWGSPTGPAASTPEGSTTPKSGINGDVSPGMPTGGFLPPPAPKSGLGNTDVAAGMPTGGILPTNTTGSSPWGVPAKAGPIGSNIQSGNPYDTKPKSGIVGGGYDGSGINPSAMTNSAPVDTDPPKSDDPSGPPVDIPGAPGPGMPTVPPVDHPPIGPGMPTTPPTTPPDPNQPPTPTPAPPANPGAPPPATPPPPTTPPPPSIPGAPPVGDVPPLFPSPPPVVPPDHVPTTPPPVPDVPLLNLPGRTAEKDALIKQLMQRAQQGTNITENDPAVKAQTDAYSAQQERARRNYLADQAESNSPYSTGAQAGLERMSAESMGQNVGQFQAQLMARELQSRRDEIQGALDQWGNTLSDEEKQGLEREKANLDASINKAQMNVQNTQYYSGLNESDKQFSSQIQQQERFKNMDDVMGRLQMAQQQGQFMAKLAQDGKFNELDDAFKKAQLSQQDSQFLKQLAQSGDIAKMENEYKRLALSQDQNQFVSQLAQQGKIAEMDDLFKKMQLSQQGSQFIAQLAQQGKYADLDNEFRKAQLSQNDSQFLKQLAQQGKIAEMEDAFNKMKLMQDQGQFMDRLGFDVEDRRNYWDWLSRGNAPPNP